MYVERELREQLKALSIELFNKQGAWRKILEKGSMHPAKDAFGIELNYKVARYYTPQTLLQYLLDLKERRDAYLKVLNEKSSGGAASEAE